MNQKVIDSPEMNNAIGLKLSGPFSFSGPIITFRPYSVVY
jgi:hypothetical protein